MTVCSHAAVSMAIAADAYATDAMAIAAVTLAADAMIAGAAAADPMADGRQPFDEQASASLL